MVWMPRRSASATQRPANAWDPEVELRVGYIDNTVDRGVVTDGSGANQAEVDNDGVDVGWVYSSSQDMEVTHHFSGASDGKNYKVSSPDAGDNSTHSTLTMTDAEAADESDVTTDVTTAVDAFEPALLVDYTDAAGRRKQLRERRNLCGIAQFTAQAGRLFPSRRC